MISKSAVSKWFEMFDEIVFFSSTTLTLIFSSSIWSVLFFFFVEVANKISPEWITRGPLEWMKSRFRWSNLRVQWTFSNHSLRHLKTVPTPINLHEILLPQRSSPPFMWVRVCLELISETIRWNSKKIEWNLHQSSSPLSSLLELQNHLFLSHLSLPLRQYICSLSESQRLPRSKKEWTVDRNRFPIFLYVGLSSLDSGWNCEFISICWNLTFEL